ncbi:MAG TPA: aminotransferase class III-fold pyridoxal phosphate-dependent enzyme [Alphaproteobacteria bacterium]|nr:aminotransferase class III-fold pyridoxal phosphate-dependent enzyme [Alphaproteobacteria bacterium]
MNDVAAGKPRANLSLEAALAESEARFTAANPKSRQRQDEAAKVMPGGNTRTVLFYTPFPVTLVKGEGCRVEDLDGHSYVDLLGEYTAGLYGHSHPVILEAVREALAGGIVLGGPNPYEAPLARLICSRFPSCELVRFTNSGTESNLMAIGTARIATGRSHVLVFEGGYHGGVLTFGAGGSPINVPFPYVMAPYNDTKATLALIERHAKELACVLVEPMMGSGGAIAAQPDFLAALREATRRHGIVLIFDEVMTSRLSSGGLQKKLGITPDLTSFGKYIGGGLTFGAFGGSAALMGRYDPHRPDYVGHAGTFNNNVLTMAAGVAGLSRLYTPEAADRLNGMGDALRQRLNELGRKAGIAVQATGVGSIMTVHFQRQPIARPEDAKATPAALRALFHLEMLARGYYLARRGFISLSLAHGQAELGGFADAFADFLATHRSILPT